MWSLCGVKANRSPCFWVNTRCLQSNRVKGSTHCPFSSLSLNMCSTSTCCKVNVSCSWFLTVGYRWLFNVPCAPCCAPAWGQEAGPQCPDVPLPAPEAADALPGEVSHPPSPDTLLFLLYISSLAALSASSSLCYPLNNIWLGVSLCVTSADTGRSQRFLTQEHQQMRRMRMEISPCMSVLGWRLWVNSALVSELLLKGLSQRLYNHPQRCISFPSRSP